ncbi:glycosyl hydrolase [Nocardioides sp. CN2-186]|uniref:glycoside hydrolase family 26 protein n=1 Tax=Nocardioides tweenelious TaxID=3156607 RepID=UPI0032B321F2
MRPTAAVKVLLAGLLTGGLIASGATPALATLHDGVAPAKPPAIAVRLAAPFATVGEPVVLTAQLRRAAADVLLTVQRRNDDGQTWTPVTSAATGSDGRALASLDTSVAGPQVLRVTGAGTSATVTLTVSDGTTCTPRVALVDTLATPAARCLATRLDRWKSAGLMGVGQQLNVSNSDYLAPLTLLGGRRVSVVGFDLEELDKAAHYEYPFDDQVIADLTRLAGEGVVLNASWHARNPHTLVEDSNHDRSWHDLSALLDSTTAEYQEFWADFDAKMALLHRLQDAGAAVVFRPFHEANGGWFWWGHPDPKTFKSLWSRMQSRAARDGVHNIVWGYSFNAVTNKTITDPTKLLPAKVDLAGMDSYDDESKANPKDDLITTGYAAVAARVSRMAITEAGPMGSTKGTWNPSIVEWRARDLKSKPTFAMLWYDDANGKKQLSSLSGGTAWLDSCINAFCRVK